MSYDLIVIGSGAGGGTLAYALREMGKKVLIIERGDYLPREKENWDPRAVFINGRYNPGEKWLDHKGKEFEPGTHYYVGGNTKFFGAALLRLREQDFEEVHHYGGISPAWPLKYADFQPYYLAAEQLYSVHGKRGEDPTEPPEKTDYSFPPLSHEPRVQELFDLVKSRGLNPFPLPIGIRLKEDNREQSECIRCDTCDGFPCLVDAKSDAHTTCIREALQYPNVTLLRNAKVHRLLTNTKGTRVTKVEYERDGKTETVEGKIIVLSCGAINSAAVLLRSKSDKFPNGLANSSDLVGRHYMCHNNSAIVAISKKKNPTFFQKTFGVNNYYFGAPDSEFPLGHIQLLGKVKPEMLEGDAPPLTPGFGLKEMAEHAMGWWITSEDLPDPNNRVKVTDEGQIILDYTPNNLEAHKRLMDKLKKMLESCEKHFHIIPNKVYLSKKIPLAAVAHQVGTCRFGTDPKTSVLDTDCKAHDLENLYVVDGAFFPSISGVNPALTIIANALRVGEILKTRL
ncbi:GMC family oxidoreductase [Simkania negevensis]|uniref:GMC oxidoreductase n=1 Tax=Simkania negevensis (strain ATCC VR-1471 / DSM 27360 / Z) TaxID=331113 RepID=F8L5K7_SIMNZ|nr:GMC family oxidoreductase [Simkania negevensis]CCB89650.1 gMC oxidoreductase [Simkania negevensis Z]